MNVAMIGHKQAPGGRGGVEAAVEQLARHMAAMGHRVTLYNRGGAGAALPRPPGVRIITVPGLPGSSLDAPLSSLLATLHAVRQGYDVLHYHGIGPGAIAWLPRLLGTPVAATVHGLDWQRAKWGQLGKAYLHLGEAVLARHAQLLITLSPGNQAYFLARHGRRAALVPNGYEAAAPAPAQLIRQRWGLERDGYFLFLARVTPEKGLHTLIRAFKTLRTEKRLVIAGEAPPGSRYWRQMRLLARGDGRILFTGYAKGRVKAELLSNCFMFVLPSSIEGMSIALLEAAAHGARCLVSNIPENTALLPEGGRSFRCESVADLHRALANALESPPVRPATPPARPGWAAIARQTLALYRRLAKK